MTETKLLEPSIADVLAAIGTAADLSPSKKTHWSCSLRQVCTGIGRPPESIAGRWSGVNAALQQLHHARVGCNPKTLSNHKANVRASLAWFAGAHNMPRRGTAVSPAWATLRAKDPGGISAASRLSGLIRYASAKGIAANDVNEEVLGSYMDYRRETTALATDDAARRRIARAWNDCADEIPEWPRQLSDRAAGEVTDDNPHGMNFSRTTAPGDRGLPRTRYKEDHGAGFGERRDPTLQAVVNRHSAARTAGLRPHGGEAGLSG